jgi:hypothetical protein
VIASVHLADVGKRATLGLMAKKLGPAAVPGLRYAEVTIAAPLGAHVLPRPNLTRVGLIAAWDDDRALARQLAHGWRVRLQPTHIFGAWSALSGLLPDEEPMDEDEPVAVLTIGRLRLTQTVRFLRASAAAERLAVGDPALLASTGLARPPALVATFSLWQSVAAMRAYAGGSNDPAHRDAVRAHAARPFHHESAFLRFRPYRAEGSWDGREPLGGENHRT